MITAVLTGANSPLGARVARLLSEPHGLDTPERTATDQEIDASTNVAGSTW